MTCLSGYNMLMLFRFIFTLLYHQILLPVQTNNLDNYKSVFGGAEVVLKDNRHFSAVPHLSSPTSPVLLAALGITAVRFVSSVNSDLNKTEFIESVRYVLMESKELSFVVSGKTAHSPLNLQSLQMCIWS